MRLYLKWTLPISKRMSRRNMSYCSRSTRLRRLASTCSPSAKRFKELLVRGCLIILATKERTSTVALCIEAHISGFRYGVCILSNCFSLGKWCDPRSVDATCGIRQLIKILPLWSRTLNTIGIIGVERIGFLLRAVTSLTTVWDNHSSITSHVFDTFH